MLISVVIPCYRSEKTIGKVVEAIKKEFNSRPEYEYQVILVNDGSPDDTMSVIKEICAKDEKIIGVDLSRNFGQASAKMSAIKFIKGEIAVFMDDDGQHDPSGVFKLVEKIQSGYDVVYAHFPKKKHSWFKRFTSWLNKRVSVLVGNSPEGIYASSFLAYSSCVIKALKEYNSPFVSIGGYLMKVTSRYANVELEHHERMEGESGYTLKKLLSLWLNTFTNFTIIPLRFASVSGIVCAMIGVIIAIITIIRKILFPTIAAGYTSLLSVMLFLGGMILMMLGLLGEYVGRIYMTISDAPQYVIRETINEK